MSVVVGVDGSPRCRSAIRAAAQEAGFRGADLIAVMAYQNLPALAAPAGKPAATLRTVDTGQAAAEATLQTEVGQALGGSADGVQTRAVAGLPGRTLVEQAQDAGAQLIVLARRSGISSMPGTVVQYVLRNAACPVLVVPAAR